MRCVLFGGRHQTDSGQAKSLSEEKKTETDRSYHDLAIIYPKIKIENESQQTITEWQLFGRIEYYLLSD